MGTCHSDPNNISDDMLSWYRKTFKHGARVEMLRAVVGPPPKTRGTVEYVDRHGTIHVDWDNGQSSGIIYRQDSCILVK